MRREEKTLNYTGKKFNEMHKSCFLSADASIYQSGLKNYISTIQYVTADGMIKQSIKFLFFYGLKKKKVTVKLK